jgi:hypothetical protein
VSSWISVEGATAVVTESKRSTGLSAEGRSLILLLVWLLSLAYMASYLKRGWNPYDEGALAQSAERVLNGELPHRDFDELYTGGLSFLNALAFRELGTNLATLRVVLFATFLLWVPAVFYVASRFVSPLVAGSIVLLCVAWSVPNYSAAMPSWYNLFFAVFGVAALLRYLETNSRRWLFAAGICGGLSILVKIIGLYYVAAVSLFFLFREQCLADSRSDAAHERSRLYRLTVAVGSAIFLVLLFKLLKDGPARSELVYFFLPPLALIALLLSREFTGTREPDRKRFATLMRMLLPFAVGVALPIAIFLVPYYFSGSLGALFHGVFIVPMTRLGIAAWPTPTPIMMAYMIPIILPLILAFDCGRTARLVIGGVLGIGLGAVLILSAKSDLGFGLGWFSISTAIPAIVLAGAAILWDSRADRKLTPLRRQQLVLLLSVTALCSLVEFPYYNPIYFCYAAPLAILAVAGLFASLRRPPGLALAVLVIFYLLFAVVRFTPMMLCRDWGFGECHQLGRLTLERGGMLLVTKEEALLFDELIPLIQTHARGKFMYATPGCPEVYFLSGLRNPTRTLFELFDDPVGRTERILDALQSHGVNIVALNEAGFRDEPIEPALRTAIEQRFPQSQEIGDFEVRWK